MIEPEHVTVYTAIFGKRDSLKDDQVTGGSPFVAVMDSVIDSKTWEVKTVQTKKLRHLSPRRRARYVKTHPWEFVETPYSVWIDGSVAVFRPVVESVNRYLASADIALQKHDERDCLYDEADLIARLHRDKRDLVNGQIARYRKVHFPEHYGLAATWVIARRHSPSCREFCNNWWEEIEKGSHRDQLSFDFVRWTSDVSVEWLDKAEVLRHGWKETRPPSFRTFPHGGG
jgi:hypothetical protein